MHSDQKAARIFGGLFILTFVTSIAGLLGRPGRRGSPKRLRQAKPSVNVGHIMRRSGVRNGGPCDGGKGSTTADVPS